MVVALTVLQIYPVEEWAFELSLSLTLTIVIAFPATYLIASANLKAFDLTQELRQLVERDRLTDVATRDYFFSRMEAEPDAYGVSVMVDIDHFKSINDSHGHLVGDAVIRDVAEVLRSCCRAEDIICRFGGEEFVIFLASADKDAGATMAERMRKAVEAHQISADEMTLQATVSVGASLKEHADSITHAIKRADDALYRAKKAGRNRVKMDWSASRCLG